MKRSRFTEVQFSLAVEFYKSVKAANPSKDITLTGHSLGGALAGYVATLFREDAQLADHIDFEGPLQAFAAAYEQVSPYFSYENAEAALQAAISNGDVSPAPSGEDARNKFKEHWNVIKDYDLPLTDGDQNPLTYDWAPLQQHILSGSITSTVIKGSVTQNDVAGVIYGDSYRNSNSTSCPAG